MGQEMPPMADGRMGTSNGEHSEAGEVPKSSLLIAHFTVK